MRSQLFSGAAVMAASLLVKDALAGPIGVRGVTVEVTETFHPLEGPDGSVSISIDYQTTTIGGGPAAPAPTSSAAAQQVNAKPQVAAIVNNPPANVPVVTTSSLPAPKPTTTAQTSAAAATGTTSTTSGSKLGLLYSNSADVVSYASSIVAAASKYSWTTGWGSSIMTLPSSMSGVEQVPQLQCTADIGVWSSNVAKAKAAGSKHLMGTNEPDQDGGGGCILSVTAAQNLWKNQMLGQSNPGFAAGTTDYSKSFTLVSPGVTNGGGVQASDPNKGLAYLKNFLADDDVNNSVDVIAIHWYASGDIATMTQNILDQVDAASTLGGKTRDVWLTEFKYTGDEAAFLAYATPKLNAHPALKRYAYNFLATGQMSTLGKPVAGLS